MEGAEGFAGNYRISSEGRGCFLSLGVTAWEAWEKGRLRSLGQ